MTPIRTKIHVQRLIILIVLTLLAFSGTLSTPMLYDDDHAVVNNESTKSLDIYPQALHPDNLLNRPVLQFTFALNRELNGLDVFGYHLVNLALHIGVGLVFYFLAFELLSLVPKRIRQDWHQVPFWAAAIHLLHPLAVEPVAYISSRSSLLASLFFLLGLICLVRFYKRETDTGLGGLELLVGFGLFFYLGCGSKAIVVTLPVIAVLYLWLVRPGNFLKDHGTEAILILSPALLYLFWRTSQLGTMTSLPGDLASETMSRSLYALTQIKSFVSFYLLKFFLPVNQNFEPDVRLVSGTGDIGVWLALVVMVAIGYFLYKKTPRLLWFGGAWSVITLLPTSSFIPLKQIVVEHRFYLPGLGMCLVLAGLMHLAIRKSVLRNSAFGVVLLLCLLLTQNRAQDFKTDVTIWEDTASKSPNKALVHNNLATTYLGQKRYDDAERSLLTTLKLNPNHSQARINLGVMYARQGQLEKAVEEFTGLINRGSSDPVVLYNAGLALKNLERPEEALPFLTKATEKAPNNADYFFTLGQVYQSVKKNDEALLAYRSSLKLNPDNPMVHLNMGTVFWEQQHFYFADNEFQIANRLKPDSPLILSNLVSSNMLFQNYEQAIHYLDLWLKLEPDNATAIQYKIAAKRLLENKKSKTK
ncbi:MAG: tetratricopeptide repeat protein [Candidatus Nitronauta litoralis]|uniref:Tetratricopeptide repeat protein n=1 Tax=Candidatus Nitronauta litoralis TaxID=2705533 RepID=A0A7T0FZM4_9BACT|nr:MAG: tetratricopeptide repeat protein [Candidatus Nitronauta litoralis]